MQFFLYEIVARIAAIYLFFDCSRKLWYGLKERKIAYFNSDDLQTGKFDVPPLFSNDNAKAVVPQ